MSNIQKHLAESAKAITQFIADKSNIDKITDAGNKMIACLKAGNTIIACGNGGSMCDAMHFAEELSGKYRNDRKPLSAIAISDASYITCVGNDYGFNEIFSRFVDANGKPGDILVGISTSGNSANVVKAVQMAKQKGMITICLTGKTGGELATLCDLEIRAPYAPYADRAQEIHIKVIHCLIDYIESGLDLK